MRRLVPAALCLLAFALAGCEVNVDNNTQASLDNAADSAGSAIGNAADAAGNLAEAGAAKVENAADAVGNTDIDVNLHGERDGNKAASDGNRH
jgi:hypothetical protein